MEILSKKYSIYFEKAADTQKNKGSFAEDSPFSQLTQLREY